MEKGNKEDSEEQTGGKKDSWVTTLKLGTWPFRMALGFDRKVHKIKGEQQSSCPEATTSAEPDSLIVSYAEEDESQERGESVCTAEATHAAETTQDSPLEHPGSKQQGDRDDKKTAVQLTTKKTVSAKGKRDEKKEVDTAGKAPEAMGSKAMRKSTDKTSPKKAVQACTEKPTAPVRTVIVETEAPRPQERAKPCPEDVSESKKAPRPQERAKSGHEEISESKRAPKPQQSAKPRLEEDSESRAHKPQERAKSMPEEILERTTAAKPQQCVMPKPEEVLQKKKAAKPGQEQRPEPQVLGEAPTIQTSSPTNPDEKEEEMHAKEMSRFVTEDWAAIGKEESLTEPQIQAFQEVFELFTKNEDGYIDRSGLRTTLSAVGINISNDVMDLALKRADYDGDGEVGFQDFLTAMTNDRRFSKCMKEAHASSHAEDVADTVFFRTLTKMLGVGTLPYKHTGEIVRYYHKKYSRRLRRKVTKHDGNHLIGYYTKGACLLGLSGKQLLKYLVPLDKTDSPYSKMPSLNKESCVPKPRLSGFSKRKPFQFLAQSRQLTTQQCKLMVTSKHPGVETKQMITPVKIKVKLTAEERANMDFRMVYDVRQKTKEGLDAYLKTLVQSKQGDTWQYWGKLGVRFSPESLAKFHETFSTYTWSWTGYRNLLQPQDLQSGGEFFPSYTQPLDTPHPSTALPGLLTDSHSKEPR
ncbi:spermatogenesis-associated protein 21 isoform X2 [Lepisosteus oculatus]|uniref:spermatogenesis-associated protein 21 isoform X2 n=1 Tax=Lepisosteus oculatus TaxID=7918 RepID=UPI00371EEEBC